MSDNIHQIGSVGLSPKRTYTSCSHCKITVHEHSRTLECDGCGKVINAFDYIFQWANKQQRIVWRNETLDSQIRDKEKLLSDLTRRIANIKSRIKRAKVN